MPEALNIVILGLSITSSWGNGHATTYRGLVRELTRRGHNVLFLERDKHWYASNRDMPDPPWGLTELYDSLDDLKARFTDHVRQADLVIVGSYVPQGVPVGEWVTQTARGGTAFYDIDTPVTLAKLARGDTEYLAPHLIPRYGMYLSFTGGPTLHHIEHRYGSPMSRPLYCSVDPELYYPISDLGIRIADLGGDNEGNPHSEFRIPKSYDLGYMGTYSDDRQPPLDLLMLEPARRWPEGNFVVAGPQYPGHIVWPPNVRRVEHLPPAEHREFYNAQRFTLNITRADMVRAGYSPSVRLFEAAACGVPIISDYWEGLDTIFESGTELLVARSPEDTLSYLRDISEEERQRIGERARRRVLEHHTSTHRAAELESYTLELLGKHLVPGTRGQALHVIGPHVIGPHVTRP